MPLVFRIMRQDADGGPTVARSSSALGIRPAVDIALDANGYAIANGKVPGKLCQKSSATEHADFPKTFTRW